MSRWPLVLPLLATILALPACGEVKNQLGLTRRTPDEFAVLTRAPLQMPPDINAPLPVPQPGVSRPQEIAPGLAAQAALLNAPVPTSENESAAENALLQKTGATATDPNIRRIVNTENARGAEDQRPVVKRLLSKMDFKDPGPAAVVDAPAELKRLKTNQQTGQPLTKGDTPTIDD